MKSICGKYKVKNIIQGSNNLKFLQIASFGVVKVVALENKYNEMILELNSLDHEGYIKDEENKIIISTPYNTKYIINKVDIVKIK
ncbi:MAG: hypothetical protein RSD47_00790 [Romboutsia sp.]